MTGNNSNDKWVTRIGLGILLMQQFVGPGGVELSLTKVDVPGVLHGVFSVVVIWLIMFWIIKKVRKKHPSIAASQKRIVTTASTCLLVLYVLNLLTYATNPGVPSEMRFAFNFEMLIRYLTGVCLMVWIIYGMYEAGYYHHLMREGQRERNELLYLQKHHQLDDLKNSVNPHFLFNSLNTLSYLVYEDSAKAERFVEELSTVYRYLLRSSAEELTTLFCEWRFIQSYITLMKIRFGESFQPEIQIDATMMQHQLPPLSLQVLLDNAVYHNLVSVERPLYISIYTEKERLVVKNNLQLKKHVASPGRLGLHYLISRYEQLGEAGVEIFSGEQEFMVKLQLIPPHSDGPHAGAVGKYFNSVVKHA